MKIDSYEKLLAMLLLQVANLPTYRNEVGATAADMTAVSEESAVLQYLLDALALADADKRTLTKIKQTAYNGEMDEKPTPFPVFPVIAPPFAVAAGCLERAAKRNRRFKAADGYTKDIGVALGIDGDSVPITPDSVLPTLEGFPAQSGYETAVVISKRGNSDMWKLLGRRVTETKWTELTSGTGKGGSFTIEPETAGKPDQLELQVQLYKNNEPYGKPSSSIYITFNP